LVLIAFSRLGLIAVGGLGLPVSSVSPRLMLPDGGAGDVNGIERYPLLLSTRAACMLAIGAVRL